MRLAAKRDLSGKSDTNSSLLGEAREAVWTFLRTPADAPLGRNFIDPRDPVRPGRGAYDVHPRRHAEVQCSSDVSKPSHKKASSPGPNAIPGAPQMTMRLRHGLP